MGFPLLQSGTPDVKSDISKPKASDPRTQVGYNPALIILLRFHRILHEHRHAKID